MKDPGFLIVTGLFQPEKVNDPEPAVPARSCSGNGVPWLATATTPPLVDLTRTAAIPATVLVPALLKVPVGWSRLPRSWPRCSNWAKSLTSLFGSFTHLSLSSLATLADSPWDS